MEPSITELKCKIRQLESENDQLYRALSDMIQRFDIQPSDCAQIDHGHFDDQSRTKRWIVLSAFNFEEVTK